MQTQPDHTDAIVTVLIILTFVLACFVLPNLPRWAMEIAQNLRL